MLLAALRRIVVIVVVVCGVTAGASLVLGALAGDDLGRSVAVGFYLAGAAVLVGSFIFGLRGPVRRQYPEGEQRKGLLPPLPTGIRKATHLERTESRRSSLLLFAFGILLVVIGAAVDPTHSLV